MTGSSEGLNNPMQPLVKHPWVGTSWEPTLSIDSHQRRVLRRHPGAVPEHVACGVVWRVGERIVGEIRARRKRWPSHEAWVAPEETP
jgi:hypothetical protein